MAANSDANKRNYCRLLHNDFSYWVSNTSTFRAFDVKLSKLLSNHYLQRELWDPASFLDITAVTEFLGLN